MMKCLSILLLLFPAMLFAVQSHAEDEVEDSNLQRLIDGIYDTDPYYRQQCVKEFGDLGTEAYKVVPKLIKALGDGKGYVRANAAAAIGEISSYAEDALPYLVIALKDKYVSVRCSVAKSLGKFGSKALTATNVLVEALNDRDIYVRQAAAESLCQVSKGLSDNIPVLLRLLSSDKGHIRLAAVRVLGEVSPESGVFSALERALKDDYWRVREAAAALRYADVGAVIARSFAPAFRRNAINVGLLIIQCPNAVDKIENGDFLTIDPDRHIITNQRTGESFLYEGLPRELEQITRTGGLVEWVKKEKGEGRG